jgi:alkanesulfonate monooxygenase SsuD/methylene tetrahydromethanopterin reductase-like flavin-dependent oxidoreductase (luciferase family)
MWYAAGNTSSYEMAARKGLGVLGFSVGSLSELEPVLAAYKATITKAEPVGGFVNDNVMVTTTAFVADDDGKARQSALDSSMSYLQSNVFRYHDTFPHPESVPYWPELLPDYTPEMLDWAIDGGLICGDPDHALEQSKRWEAAGADQLVFGVGMATHEEYLTTIRLMGEHVIPKVDTDPVHSTTRYRQQAAAKL